MPPPPDDLLWSLERIVASGKVLHLGISDAPAWIASAMQATARERSWQGFTAVQLEYSLKERTPERDLLPMAASLGLAVAAWSPLGSGALTGKYAREGGDRTRLAAGYPVELGQRTQQIATVAGNVAARLGCSAAQVAIAWLLSRTPAVIPIIGARSATQLAENIAARDVQLPPEVIEELDAISSVPGGFPHDFLRGPLAQFALWGNCATRIIR